MDECDEWIDATETIKNEWIGKDRCNGRKTVRPKSCEPKFDVAVIPAFDRIFKFRVGM